jgi:hypothetical protein
VLEAHERLVSAFREGRDKFGSFADEATIVDGGRWFGSLAEYRAGWDAWTKKMGLWGSETASAGCVASGADHSFFRLFERRRTCVHHDGVEFERTPLFEHLERPVPGPQRRVRVPPV